MIKKNQLAELCSEVEEFICRGGSGIEDGFEELALRVFRFQVENNPAYQRYCERLGRCEAGKISEIPGVVTAAFKELDLTAVPPEQRSTVFHSSGTTEHKPSRHYHNKQTLKLYEESLLAYFKPHLLPDVQRARFLILGPRAEEAPHSSLAHMFETVGRIYGSEVEFVGNVAADRTWILDSDALDRLKFDEPVVICGTAFSFVHWCDYLKGRVSFPRGSRVFETGGYKGRSRTIPKTELHELIEEKLGIPQTHIVSEYGMSELSSQGYDRVAGSSGARVFRFPHWARAMIVSPETGRESSEGETGLVRIYDLANVGSVMAIQTEDLAIRRGTGFELIGRAALAEARGCSLLEVSS